jgi:diguanylate cyclase (GGDEF)-like protein
VATLFVVGTLVAMLRGSVNDLVARLNALAQTDELTGLGNRRHLLSALDEAISTSTPQARVTVALLDLDGFKNYNDSFGHPAGDALLARLAGRLQESLDGAGQAFRLGGDEFCVIVTGDAATRLDAVARAAAALTERGEGFAIGASTGIVEAPTEVSTSIAALALADQRLYGEKMLRQPARAQRLSQAADRSPHDRRTADYARHVAARLGLGGEELDIVVRAAELHDIGMIAIPQDLLRERGELSDDQREFLRSYVLIGERLLHATPPLREVAQIVRCAQERWDGSGYPDGLAGTAIPLAARIVAACSAFTAMTSERDYRSRLTDEEAIGELRSGAGSQFDPDVVEALVATLRDLVPLTDPTASTLTEH